MRIQHRRAATFPHWRDSNEGDLLSTYGLLKSITFNTRLHRFFIPSYDLMFKPRQLCLLTSLATEALGGSHGSFVEVGGAYGNTTLFLNKHLSDLGVERAYHCIDTFSGFTGGDVDYELDRRNKSDYREMFRGAFGDNDPKYLKRALSNEGISNVSVHEADARDFDYRSLAPIAFCLVDVDLYLPVKEALERISPHLAEGAVVVVDDCVPEGPWDGAHQAYQEFARSREVEEDVQFGLGIIRAGSLADAT